MSSIENVYEMDRELMGFALIINNLHGDFPPHEGTRKDVENLEKMFKLLQIKVKAIKNLSKSQTEKIVKKLTSADFANFNLFILVVLSHGTQVRISENNINL